MKSAVFAVALFSTLAFAGPVKRAIVTEWEVETVTVYVPAPTQNANQSPDHFVPSTTASAIATPSTSSSSSLSSSSLPSPSSSSSAVDYSDLSDYAAPILEQHNIHRDNHTVPPLQWDDELASLAKQIADTCVYAHSNAAGDGNYGQNIGAGAPPDEIPKMITNDMYNGEITHYPGYGSEPDMSNFHVWGHFSQIVWKDTQNVGCYTTKCGSLANVGGNVSPYFTVCNYRPSGNYGGQYSKNVLKPIGESSVVV